MIDVADAFQDWLLDGQSRSLDQLEDLSASDERQRQQLGLARLAQRVAKGVRSFEDGASSPLDLAVLIRQAIRSFRRRFWLPSSHWETISRWDQRAGLYATSYAEGQVEVAARPWTPEWLPFADSIDEFEVRRVHSSAPGTGTLKQAYGFSTYQSEAQKAAVEACEFAAPGSTTLVTLPTGGGKSLCSILPAWRRSLGGTKRGGTTVVIVPTVALAMDQYASAQRYFLQAHGPAFEPQLWTGQTSLEERDRIREGVEAGTIPLLFTSPESLLQSSLRNAVVSSALSGNLATIVVDEAHIVATWGAQFRADFQMLGAFIRQLFLETNKTLRTILLSATIDFPSERILEQLFSYGSFTVLRANAVRPEPSWWFDWTQNEQVRKSHVIEAIAHLPRPAILYVTTRDDASQWLADLRNVGYQRVASFTGETNDEDREKLLRLWRDDDIDIMVATSAFGLGVDKPDVRTVVHACLPETIDRFYQEVGRGGRDGNSCVSLVCAIPEDADIALSLTKSSRISTEKAVYRWLGMRRRMRAHDKSSALLTVDIDAPPNYAPDMLPGDRHRDWNMHTLLMLQRAGFLELVDAPRRENPDEDAGSDSELHSVDIRIKATEVLHGTYDDIFRELDPYRRTERGYVSQQVQHVSNMVRQRSGSVPAPTECIASLFASLYPDCGRSCGGCPECRRIGRSPYSEGLEFFIEHITPQNQAPVTEVHGNIAEILGSRGRLTVLKPERLSEISPLLGSLVHEGISQLVIADEFLSTLGWIENAVNELVDSAELLHFIIPEWWLRDREDVRLRAVPTAVLYPAGDERADMLHEAFKSQWTHMPAKIPVVSIVREGTYLRSESGRFVDRVPGHVMSGEKLLQELRPVSRGWF